MRIRLVKELMILCCLVSGLTSFSQLIIQNNQTAEEMAGFMTGKGVKILNAQLSGANSSHGIFRSNNTGLGMDSGIILTTGLSYSALSFQIGADRPAQEFANSNNGTRGDADLEALIRNLRNTFDACTLEFDFIPIGDSIEFNFLFGSEEYPEFNCSEFNDIFAFLISGPGFSKPKNIALVPGTNVPVAINTINDGTVNPKDNIRICNLFGPGSPFTDYYTDNSANYYVVYDGLTKKLSVKASVRPCQTYHLKLCIADIGDGYYDSGVFIEANSFNSKLATISPVASTDINGSIYLVEGCEKGKLRIGIPKISTQAQSFGLDFAGTAQIGSDINSLPLTVTVPAGDSVAEILLEASQDNLTEGIENVKLFLYSSTCQGSQIIDSCEFFIRDYKELNATPTSAGICNNQTVQLNVMETNFTSFAWKPRAGLSDSTIRNPIATPSASTVYYITASETPTCKGLDSVIVYQKTAGSIKINKKDISCRGDDGQIVLSPEPGWINPMYSFNGATFSGVNVFTNLMPGIYPIDIKDDAGCSTRLTVELIRLEDVSLSWSVVPANCFGTKGKLLVTPIDGRAPFRYSLDGINFQPDSAFSVPEGSYTVYVQDDAGCTANTVASVLKDSPIRVSTQISADSCRGLMDGNVVVSATGGSNNYYSYSIGNTIYSNNQLKLAAGSYIIAVKDDKDCFTSIPVVVPLKNTIVVDAGKDTTICEGISIAIASSSNANRFNWMPGNTLSNDSVLSPVASPVTTTMYTLTAKAGLCERTTSLVITVLPAPPVSAGEDASICYGKSASLNATGANRFEWSPLYYLSSPVIANPVVSPRRTTDYFVRTIGENGCRSTTADTVKVTVIPSVKAFAGNDTTIAIGQTLQLMGSGGDRYQWWPPTYLSDPSLFNPTVNLNQPFTYYLTVTSANDCVGKDTINIKVYKGPDIYVPNAFTPDNNGSNETLKIIAVGLGRLEYFKIFNRLGGQVFSTNNANKGWDGNIQWQKQASGTYIWIVKGTDYLGKPIIKKGSLLLIR
jgi:gliding motility-associated-like protein